MLILAHLGDDPDQLLAGTNADWLLGVGAAGGVYGSLLAPPAGAGPGRPGGPSTAPRSPGARSSWTACRW
jgi:hypothetical protein